MDSSGSAFKSVISGFDSKSRYYFDKAYLYGLTFFIASQACYLTNRVSVLFYSCLYILGAFLISLVAVFRLTVLFASNIKKALIAVVVLAFGIAYLLYSVFTDYSPDSLAFLFVVIAAIGAVGVKVDHILISGIIGNIVMVIYNVFTSFINPDEEKGLQEFFYLGNNSFYISKINNRSLSDMAAHYFWIVIAYLWIRGKKITWGEIIALSALNALIYSATGSNTTLICFSFALLITICFKLFSHIKKDLQALKRIISFCAIWSFIVIAVLMFILTFTYNSQNQFLYRLNSILHERLSIGQRGIVECGISLFASDVKIFGENASLSGFYNFLDCSYISLLIKYGILPLLFYIASMTFVQIRQKKYIYGTLLLAVCALSCIEEHHLSEIPYNFFILLIFADLDINAKLNHILSKPEVKKYRKISLASVITGLCFIGLVIGVNIPRYVAIRECDRLDNKAADIYDAVQDSIDALSDSGIWEQQVKNMSSGQYGNILSEPDDYSFVTGKNWNTIVSDPKSHAYYSLTYHFGDSNNDISELIIDDNVKDIVGYGSVVIEYDVIEGTVYSVWYSDSEICKPVSGGRDVSRAERLKQGEGRVGYYAGVIDA